MKFVQTLPTIGEGTVRLGPKVEHPEAVAELRERATVGGTGTMFFEIGDLFGHEAQRWSDNGGRLHGAWQLARHEHVDFENPRFPVGREPIAQRRRLAVAERRQAAAGAGAADHLIDGHVGFAVAHEDQAGE